MSLFEFLMVLVSIIIGLGLASILTGVARLIRSRDSVRFYWVHGVLTAAIFFALLQQWWEIWALATVPEWTFPGLVMMLAGPVGLYLIAHLLFPEPVAGASLRNYYYGEMRPVWWIGVVTVALATLFRPLVFGDVLFSMDNQTSFIFFVGFVVLGLTRRAIAHHTLTPIFLVLLLWDIARFTFSLGQL